MMEPEKDDPKIEPAVSDANDSKKEGDGAPASNEPSLLKLLAMALPELHMMILAVILMIFSEATGLVTPIIMGKVYDALVSFELTAEERMSEINSKMIAVMILFLAGVVGGWLRSCILAIIGERVVARLRNKLYASILKQEIAFFDEHKSGELVSRLSSDTTLLQSVISSSLPEVFIGLIKGFVGVGLMFYISPSLGGVAFGGLFLVLLCVIPLGKMMARLSKEYQDILGEAQTYSTEVLGAMRTVQSFAAEEKEIARYSNKIGDPAASPLWWPLSEPSTYRTGFFKGLTMSSFFVLIFGGGFGFLYISQWYGFYIVNNGTITIGDLTAFQSYVFTIGMGFASAGGHMANLLNGLGATGRIFYLLERIPSIPKPTPTDDDDGSPKETSGESASESTKPVDDDEAPAPPAPLEPESMEGNIELHNISFSYPSRPGIAVLEDVSLQMRANTTTALVGSSGAGKSTVVALLQRFYDVKSGYISVDGHDICDLDLKWLRKHIGYVQQEPQLFGLTVKENLLYGVDREITDEEIHQRCLDANCHDFISAWPMGYETVVGERGVKLSGGQKQRIAIARALLSNCRILLLDEATSALDAESEHVVQEAIDRAIVGRTVIVIAHRLSTIRGADQIVVMHDHKIVGTGTHENLLESCTKYKELIKRQSLQ